MINRIIIYTKRVEKMIVFYEHFFNFKAVRIEGDHIIELRPESGGAILMLHPMGPSRKEGQTLVKLVFDVRDVPKEIKRLNALGLKIGTMHQADGYQFANAKDPSQNSISISSRRFIE